MPRGSPDHVRLMDDAHSRYTWKWDIVDSRIIADSELRTFFDLSFEGVLTAFSVYSDYKLTTFKIYVDDVLIQDLIPSWIFEYRMLRNPGGGLDIMGISRYDEINDHYSLWWQSHFKCYVRKSVKITAIQESGGPKWVKYPIVHYLERV